MALVPIMAARIATGTLGGAMSARSLAKASPIKKNINNVLTTPFNYKNNESGKSHRAVHTTNNKSSRYLTMEELSSMPMATHHLILVRNAEEQTSKNESAGLTVIGREQAALAAKRLFEMDLPITKIVNNGQQRAVETSSMIASYLSETQNEVDSGLKSTQQDSVEEAVKKYLSFDSFKQNADSYDLVVCDEDMIKHLITRAMNLKSVEQVSEFDLPHASVSELAVHPDGQVSVRALDETVCLGTTA